MDQKKGYESGSSDDSMEVTSPIKKLVAKDDGGPSNIRCVVCGDPVPGGENELREHMKLHFHGVGIEEEFNWLIQKSLNPTYEDATRPSSGGFRDQQVLAERSNQAAAAARAAAAAAQQEEMDVDVDVGGEGEGDQVPDDAQSETD